MKPQPSTSIYTRWTKWFAWRPVRLRDQSVVWLRRIYRRQRIMEWTPSLWTGPDRALVFKTTEYDTIENVLTQRLTGENRQRS